jgi:xanthine/CO dehydrogenase XdhC/CoxF family maturation factor
VTETESVFAAVADAAREDRPVVLATIVRARGSTPRGAGSRMLVDPARGLVGTVGGGCGEAQVIEVAREVLQDGKPRLVRVDLTDDLSGWSPAVCGGVFDVFLERCTPRPPACDPDHDPDSHHDPAPR